MLIKLPNTELTLHTIIYKLITLVPQSKSQFELKITAYHLFLKILWYRWLKSSSAKWILMYLAVSITLTYENTIHYLYERLYALLNTSQGTANKEYYFNQLAIQNTDWYTGRDTEKLIGFWMTWERNPQKEEHLRSILRLSRWRIWMDSECVQPVWDEK